VGEQGFTNVSHGCVNMSPADAETFYKMAVPGDPVNVTGSPRAGVWDDGWTMWFLSWKQWLRGSASGKAVRAGPRGSSFVSPASLNHHRRPTPRGALHAHSMASASPSPIGSSSSRRSPSGRGA
jgi:hypothetical protein